MAAKLGVEQRRDLFRHESRIGNVCVAHRIGEASRFDQKVQPFRAIGIERAHIEAIENVEHHQRREALAIGWQFDHLKSAIIRRDRRHLVAAMRGKIRGGQHAAMRLQRRHHVIGNLALVEGTRAVFRQHPQRAGERRKSHHVPGLGRLSVDHEMLCGDGVFAELCNRELPVERDPRLHRDPGFGGIDCRLQHAVETEAAMRPQDFVPGFDRARNCHGVDGIGGDVFQTLLDQSLGAHRRTGAAGSVIAPDRLARPRHQTKAVASDAGHVRFADAGNRHRGDGRIGGTAAGAHDLHRCKRGERVRGCDHSAGGIGRRAAGQVEVTCHVNSAGMIGDNQCGIGCWPSTL